MFYLRILKFRTVYQRVKEKVLKNKNGADTGGKGKKVLLLAENTRGTLYDIKYLV